MGDQFSAIFSKAKPVLVQSGIIVTVLVIIAGSCVTYYNYLTLKELSVLVKSQSEIISKSSNFKESVKNSDSTSFEISNINKQLAIVLSKISNNSSSKISEPSTNVTPTPDAPAYLGMIRTVNDPTTTVNIYDVPSNGGNIISTVPSDDLLFYYKTAQGWYQIELEPGNLGWIQADLVIELPSTTKE